LINYRQQKKKQIFTESEHKNRTGSDASWKKISSVVENNAAARHLIISDSIKVDDQNTQIRLVDSRQKLGLPNELFDSGFEFRVATFRMKTFANDELD
jgi:hypothetical protein